MILIFLPFALFEAKITFKGFLKLQENIYSFPGRVAFFCMLTGRFVFRLHVSESEDELFEDFAKIHIAFN